MRQYIPCLTAVCLFSALLVSSPGCSMLPESLQPQNLQKLNRGSGYSDDPFFSIPDSEATARQQALRNAFDTDLEAKDGGDEVNTD